MWSVNFHHCPENNFVFVVPLSFPAALAASARPTITQLATTTTTTTTTVTSGTRKTDTISTKLLLLPSLLLLWVSPRAQYHVVGMLTVYV